MSELKSSSIDNQIKAELSKVANNPTENNAREFVAKVNKTLPKSDPLNHNILKELKRSITLAEPKPLTENTLQYIHEEIKIHKTEMQKNPG